MRATTMLLILVAFALVAAQRTPQDDLAVVRQRVIQSQFLPNASSTEAEIVQWTKTLRPNATWPDVHYDNESPGLWFAEQHLKRVYIMSVSWADPKSPLHQNSTVLTTALVALRFWINNNFTNPNWWWNEVGVPLDLGPSCLILQPKFSSNETLGCTKYLNVCNYTAWTGTNLVWVGECTLFNGLLNGNAAVAGKVFQDIFASILVTPSYHDGIKEDYSYFMHGSQFMNGAYGEAFVQNMLMVLPWADGTAFQASTDVFITFANYVIKGTEPLITFPSAQWDVSAVGRGFTRPMCCQTALEPLAGVLASLPGPNQTALQAFARKLENPLKAAPLTAAVHYWKADYVGWRRPTWYASVKMYSRRIGNAECVNNEGKKSLHLSDGVSFVYLDGYEYTDSAPTLNWDQLPGTTVEQGLVPLECTNVRHPTNVTFVGGATDGATSAVAVFDFVAAANGTLRGKKFWAFYEDCVVWLGAGLTATSSAQVLTSVMQMPLNGSLYVNSTVPFPFPSNRTLPFGDTPQPLWFYHNKVGYILPSTGGANKGNKLEVGASNRTGSWADVGDYWWNVTRSIAFGSVDHTESSHSPSGASYLVIVVPDVPTVEQFQSQAAALSASVAVITNTAEAQAVAYRGTTLSAVVYNATASISGDGWSLTASMPVAVVLSDEANTLTVSDPAQRPMAVVRLTFTTPKYRTQRNATVELPDGEMHGSSVVVRL
eukprot:TRINITY_DN6793_c0_g1_i1.p1 TRINITY_DN6793_c0_g1~~TRINITY_DN6793_c0_g1_i1.p1  ORF type:complete len:714 (-),score=119.54 TRINITY_DN6793_c0_g1_i1:1034-3175(-)